MKGTRKEKSSTDDVTSDVAACPRLFVLVEFRSLRRPSDQCSDFIRTNSSQSSFLSLLTNCFISVFLPFLLPPVLRLSGYTKAPIPRQLTTANAQPRIFAQEVSS